MDHLVVDMEKCTGCGICMLACSERKFGIYKPSAARIRVSRETLPDGLKVDLCRQCENAPCAAACPVGAIALNDSGVWEVDEKTCIGCGRCVTACPFGAMFMDTVSKKAFKCDLCGGSPECVVQCPKGALDIVSGK